MSISCDCDIDYYPEPGDVCWDYPADYSQLETSKRKRCCSCKTLIDVGAVVTRLLRYKVPETDVEIRIYGEEEKPLAPHYMCETCSDIYFSISELGYCFSGRDMRQVLEEYHQLKRDEAAWKDRQLKY